ncbi:hypothetical protein [Rudaea sp.]|uniref:hypothetical protein n=1 Tax=Rudaea sp. TaxID=2136325 RepID=UPI0032200C3F
MGKSVTPMMRNRDDDGPTATHFLSDPHGRRNTVMLIAAAILAAIAASCYAEFAIVVPACRGYGQAQGMLYAGTKTWNYRQEEGTVCMFRRADGSETAIPLQKFMPFLQSLTLDWTLDLRLSIPSFIALFTLSWLGLQRVLAGAGGSAVRSRDDG